MYQEIFEPYIKIFKDHPKFHRGSFLSGLPIILFFFIVGLFSWPFLLLSKFGWFKKFIFGLDSQNGCLKLEVLFGPGPNHNIISSNLDLSETNKLYVNYSKFYTCGDYISNRRLAFCTLIYALPISFLLIKSLHNPVLRQNDIRVIKARVLKEFFCYYIKNYKIIIQYNDHSPYSVLLRAISEFMGIKTVYVQHAPVSYQFPPLHHDLNVLFSNDSLTKYKKVSSNWNITKKYFVFCDLRFPTFNNLPARSDNYILICFNKVDQLSEVNKTINALLDLNYAVKIRPHPEDKRNFRIFGNINISKNQSIWDDLRNSSAVIVNESAVILEALHYKIPTYKLCTWSTSTDHYSFIEEGLIIKEYYSNENLMKDLKNGIISTDNEKLPFFVGNINKRSESRIILEKKINELTVKH